MIVYIGQGKLRNDDAGDWAATRGSPYTVETFWVCILGAASWAPTSLAKSTVIFWQDLLRDRLRAFWFWGLFSFHLMQDIPKSSVILKSVVQARSSWKLRISSKERMPVVVPMDCTQKAATAFPNRAHSSSSHPLEMPVRNPATNASPAPDVSTTSTS